jgi:hypothetical protein
MIIFQPTSKRKVAISLYNNLYFYRRGTETIPFINIAKNQIPANSALKFAPRYSTLEKKVTDQLKIVSNDPLTYNFGIVHDVKINELKPLEPVDTYTWGKFASSLQNNVIKTEGQMNIPVLVGFNTSFALENSNDKFLQQIHRLSAYWFVPFFIYVDVEPQNIGGPLFVKKFEIQCNPTVSINLDFVGGTSIVGISSAKMSQYIDENPGFDYDFTPNNENRQVFRAAKNYDCFVVLQAANQIDPGTDIYEQFGTDAEQYTIDGVNILDMSLTVSNDLTLTYTANYGKNKSSLNSLNFISQKSRTVTGSLRFLASTNLSQFLASQNRSMIMYFGSVFYYPMQNVFFDVFDLTVNADNASFEHSLRFTALLQPSPYIEYFKQNHFDLNYRGLFGPPTGEIYFEKQDEVTN